jgi:hypothetical protein
MEEIGDGAEVEVGKEGREDRCDVLFKVVLLLLLLLLLLLSYEG